MALTCRCDCAQLVLNWCLTTPRLECSILTSDRYGSSAGCDPQTANGQSEWKVFSLRWKREWSFFCLKCGMTLSCILMVTSLCFQNKSSVKSHSTHSLHIPLSSTTCNYAAMRCNPLQQLCSVTSPILCNVNQSALGWWAAFCILHSHDLPCWQMNKKPPSTSWWW